MINEIVKHVGIHACQHPKETIAAAIAAAKVVGPVVVAAAPYVAVAAATAGVIHALKKL